MEAFGRLNQYDISAADRQEAPLTPEYQAIFEANLKDQPKAARHRPDLHLHPDGMPRAMNVIFPMAGHPRPPTS